MAQNGSKISIAVDGPSGAGKSSLARALAARLGYLYVDTGAIYRTVGLYTFRQKRDPGDESAVSALLPTMPLGLRHEDGAQHMFLGDENVSGAIRSPEMSRYAALVSKHPAVRAFLLEMQKSLAAKHNTIMDGRDIGTVVLPDAKVKIFLTATAEKRAARRHLELTDKGISITFDEVLNSIKNRDERDMTRAVSPLRAASDAVVLDTTELDFGASLQALIEIVQGKVNL